MGQVQLKNGDPWALFPNLNSMFSELYAGSVGTVYYLDPTHGSDANTGLFGSPVATLAAGYALLRDGYNDTLVYIPGATAVTLTAGFTWSKNYAHFIGACPPVPVGQRCRIVSGAAVTGITSLFTVSGQGCMFQNIFLFHGANDTTASFAMTVTGQRNAFDNCHFAGIGHVNLDVAGAGSLSIAGGSENRFVHCTIGLDTITRTVSTCELQLSLATTRNQFEDCTFESYIAAAGHAFVEVLLGTGIDRWTQFRKCLFTADSVNRATALTSVFIIPAISQGIIPVIDCMVASHGAAPAWNSTNRGVVRVGMPTATASAGGGIATVS